MVVVVAVAVVAVVAAAVVVAPSRPAHRSVPCSAPKDLPSHCRGWRFRHRYR